MKVIDSLYSSIVVGSGAIGKQILFCHPQGVEIPFLGSDEAKAKRKKHQKIHSPLTTGVMRASDAGVVVGDFLVSKIRIDLEKHAPDEVLKELLIQLSVNGVKCFGERVPASLATFDLNKPLFIGRTHSLEGSITVRENFEYDGDPFIVGMFLDGERQFRESP